MDGRTDGAIIRMDEWAVGAGVGVGLITAREVGVSLKINS